MSQGIGHGIGQNNVAARRRGNRVAPWRLPALVAVALFGLLLIGCSSAAEEAADTDADTDIDTSAAGAQTADAAGVRRELKPTIRIAVTDWTAAHLNASIAEQLIERRLGYPVEQVAVVETAAMLNDLALGELDAILEVWPSSLEPSEAEMITSGRVEDLGGLGVIGKTGWFVPRYVIEANSALTAWDLTDWQAYADRGVAAEFATAETGSLGRFLGTDTNYEQFDEEIIDSLNLPFEVVFSGSDEATAAELAAARSTGEPVLLFWWTPTAEVTEFDLVNVALPERTADCEAAIASGSPQNCDYPTDRLKKLASPLLNDGAPDVFSFLDNFSLTTNDQLLMVDLVENEGRSVDAVAAEWIDENQDRWEAWITDG